METYKIKRQELMEIFLSQIDAEMISNPRIRMFIENSYMVGFNDALAISHEERIAMLTELVTS